MFSRVTGKPFVETIPSSGMTCTIFSNREVVWQSAEVANLGSSGENEFI